ncbi:MAG: GDYXXLXY domain-containing protein [Burkholderiaceae bacterium]|nr:GDYXXLXY domain-containing protein [Rhodoferax sp.]MCB2007122.1 GDYXXLXY domain-containing protein [Rhodoferax sp.]MCB2031416.1 GDYXXLXY domain-containing protein [Rhodoferax sp.]MCB2044148.1 GDYXXLXY domain-containing protein [Rhodoferax sp.]MCP5262142.1 GDYXXLXY domain-containing protein [Rhodoferax sp.]
MRSAIALAWALAALALVTASIVTKERQLASGRIVLLELAPVDPRSLMQGDYMTLRYTIAEQASADLRKMARPGGAAGPADSGKGLPVADGHIVATLDANAVAAYRRLHGRAAIGRDEILLRYRVRNDRIRFATNAFFFQEGTARRYEPARYGEFRVAADGELLLTGLRDAQRRPL